MELRNRFQDYGIDSGIMESPERPCSGIRSGGLITAPLPKCRTCSDRLQAVVSHCTDMVRL